FFSKFPVSEIPTLAFNAIAWLWLLRAWRASEKDASSVYALVLSAAAFGASCFCRISGFLFVPLILLYVWALLAHGRLARAQAAFAAGAVVLFALSCAYGLVWTFP